MCQSEVALLRQHIADEYEAMKRGLNGLAYGTAKHTFIDVRMKRVDSYHEQLARQIGEQEADSTVYELYRKIIG